MAKTVITAKRRLMVVFGFSNLGLWSAADDYPEAARALARLVGGSARLRGGDRVLELGCGRGAAFEEWAAFGVSRIVGIEPDATAFDAAQQAARTIDVAEVCQGTASRIRVEEPFDVALAVDAAYHFDRDWLARLGPALVEGGRLVFTDLVRDRELGLGAYLAGRLCRLGPGAPRSVKNIEDELCNSGFDMEELKDLTEDVLVGFCNWADNPERGPGPPVSGVAIKVTASLIRTAIRRGWIRYVIVRARRR